MNSESGDQTPSSESPADDKQERRVIKIGSQRDVPASQEMPQEAPEAATPAEAKPEPLLAEPGVAEVEPLAPSAPQPPMEAAVAQSRSEPAVEPTKSEVSAAELLEEPPPEAVGIAGRGASFPPPRIQRLPEDLQKEIDDALRDISLDDLLQAESGGSAATEEPEIEKRYSARVVKVHREDVFFSLPGHYEGVASLRQFDQPPEPGAALEVVVNRFNADEGLYEVSVPGASAQVQDWSDLEEGLVVETRVTGHNSGGLECEIHAIRGFIPVSQISLYRVDDLEQFVGEKFTCIVTEANPARGNLVLSRRGVLEREQAEQREKLLQALEVGQTREGVVRSIRDFGAFVDIGGIDGLIHISKLSWDRIAHPSEVLEEGQKVQVQIEKIDEATGKIGLSYRDLLEHPWERVSEKYPESSVVTGTVSKIMDFGAFVRLEPGVEGLVHISELAHHRVVRVANVVREGEVVTVKVLSVDPEAQRMSLSIKAVMASPEETAAENESAAEEETTEPPREKAVKPFSGTLRGGTNHRTGGDQFGLKW